ncbi:solute carrier family 66 member 2 isoform X5 [Plodia interpunctella]|uniref:solute carrier family 66 member 2 isoform X5 n=1 Tax=Plodia interpunctella TaxID=58824 RepID=UPI0023685107|nr:solute carrier family 66 member 2 isoform X5 [Plodia interpunctella]
MDWIISDELGLTVGHLVGWGAAGAMIVGGVAPYIPQYRQIKRTQDAEGFSLYVCLALLIANTLRILFWFGKRYELPLLIQSIVMNVTMFVMIHLCVNVQKKNQIIRARERIFTAHPDDTAHWLDQRSGLSGTEKPHRFYATKLFILICGICAMQSCELFSKLYIIKFHFQTPSCFLRYISMCNFCLDCYLFKVSFGFGVNSIQYSFIQITKIYCVSITYSMLVYIFY